MASKAEIFSGMRDGASTRHHVRWHHALGVIVLLSLIAGTWNLHKSDAAFGTCVPAFAAETEGAWHGSGSAGEFAWVLNAATGDERSGTAHITDAGMRRYEASLTSPAFTVAHGGTQLELEQRRQYSWANTTGVLELAIDGGPFVDVAAAGGTFAEGGYDGRSPASNPLGFRDAWVSMPDNSTHTRVELPAALQGKSVQMRFRIGSSGTGDLRPGWYIEDIHCMLPSQQTLVAPLVREQALAR